MIEELPKEIVLWGIRYELAGYSKVSSKNITAVIMWRGEFYFYDGLGVSDQVRMKPLDKRTWCTNLKDRQDLKYIIFCPQGIKCWVLCMCMPTIHYIISSYIAYEFNIFQREKISVFAWDTVLLTPY